MPITTKIDLEDGRLHVIDEPLGRSNDGGAIAAADEVTDTRLRDPRIAFSNRGGDAVRDISVKRGR